MPAVDAVTDAEPELRVNAAIIWLPVESFTVPVGTPLPCVGETVAFKVTLLPSTTPAGVAVSVTELTILLVTVICVVAEVEGLKPELPLYLAVTV